MRALKGHGEEHQRRGGAWHPEAKDEPGGGPGGGQAQSGARWGDSWEGAIRFVGKEVSGWRAGPRPGVKAEVGAAASDRLGRRLRTA